VTTGASLEETLKTLAGIAARKDMPALAELEAEELAGPARTDVLEAIADVRREHERKPNYVPAAIA
jgi:hypothetical protein